MSRPIVFGLVIMLVSQSYVSAQDSPNVTEKAVVPHYLIGSLEVAPFLTKTGESTYRGFIEDLVKKLSEKLKFTYAFKTSNEKTLSKQYEILFGYKDVTFYVAPITNIVYDKQIDIAPEFITAAFMNVSTTAVVRKDSHYHRIDDIFNNTATTVNYNRTQLFCVVKSGSTEELLDSKNPAVDGNIQWIRNMRTLQRDLLKVEHSVQDCINRTKTENLTLLIEEPLGRVIVKTHCDLKPVGDFQSQGGYSIVFREKRRDLVKQFNDALLEIVKEPSFLKDLESRWMDDLTCAATTSLGSLSVFCLVTVLQLVNLFY